MPWSNHLLGSTVDTDVVDPHRQVPCTAPSIQLQKSGSPLALARTTHITYKCHLPCSGKRQVHAFRCSNTGCDTTSAFCGKGKKSAWEAWNSYPSRALHSHPLWQDEQSRICQWGTERVVLSEEQDNGTLSGCAALEASGLPGWDLDDMWMAQQQTPSPEGCGWTLDRDSQSWLPVWSILPMASKACSELVKCVQKHESVVQGAHARRHWKCTELCSCKCD